MRNRALATVVLLALATAATAQPQVADPDVRRGIALVDEGEYDSAILALDGAVRRLATEKGHSSNDLAEAYFYLGVAYLGKGHETSAKARFRDAVKQARDMSPSAEKFPPRVIELFEKAKEESRAESPAESTTTTTAAGVEPAKKGGSKTLLVVAGVAVVGGGAALALGGGGGEADGADNPPSTPAQTFNASGSVADGESMFYTFVAARSGTMEATITWQDRAVALTMNCQLNDPPYTNCTGTYNRLTDTTGRLTSPVSQTTYLVAVNNFSGRAGAEPFTITIRYP